jgi:hypothetical protein
MGRKKNIFITSNNKDEKNKKLKTLFDLINETKEGNLLPSNKIIDLDNNNKSILLNKKRKNSLITLRTLSNNKSQSSITNNLNSPNEEYIKSIKPKVVMKNGKISIEKPDIGLINKQYNDNLNKSLFPLEEIEDNNKKISSLSFKKINHCNKWKEEETNIFYKAIEVFGLDFSFLEIVLFPRTRNEIKNKYLKEEKVNKDKLNESINAKKNVSKMFEVLKIFQNKEKERDLNNCFNNENIINEYQNILLHKNIINHSEKEIKNLLNEYNNEFIDDSNFENINSNVNSNNVNNNNNNIHDKSTNNKIDNEDNFINNILNKF